MMRLAQLRSGLPIARVCRPPTSRPYTNRGKNVDAKATTSQTATKSSDPYPEMLSALDLGFDDWSEINTREKTINTAAGPLPISPLLDSAWRDARQRKRKKVPQDEIHHNRFQRKMIENPYAQVLAEPVRYCHITRVRLPNPFLQNFGLVKHPETNQVWWIPADFEHAPSEPAPEAPGENEPSAADAQLDATESRPAYGLQERAASQSVVGATDVPSSSPDAALEATSASEPAVIEGDAVAADSVVTRQEPPTKTRGSGKFFAPVHMVARQDLMLEFFDKKSRFVSGFMRFASNPTIGKLCKGATWRQDMHEVIRDQMRRQIADELVYLWRLCEEKGRDYLIKVDGLEDFKSNWNRFCCLFLGEGGLDPFEILEVAGTAAKAVPGYDLNTLLGPDSVETLRSEASVFRDATIIVLKGKRTIDLSKKLWRLQGFVADYTKLV